MISWSHTPNHFSCTNLIIIKYELRSQYVKLTQLWPLTVNCVKVGLSVLSRKLIVKFSKICFFCIYVDQMIIRQRNNAFLQLQLYNIFTNVGLPSTYLKTITYKPTFMSQLHLPFELYPTLTLLKMCLRSQRTLFAINLKKKFWVDFCVISG